MELRNRFQGINSASLCSLAGRYDNPIPPWFLAPVDSLKIPAQARGIYTTWLFSYPDDANCGQKVRPQNSKEAKKIERQDRSESAHGYVRILAEGADGFVSSFYSLKMREILKLLEQILKLLTICFPHRLRFSA
jgi:hypothetical protein